MSVVLRCPNCGTTRKAPGECEACHEAQARYFCTNHEPGVWLDGEACSRCGAHFGEAPRRLGTAPLAERKRAPTPVPRASRPPAAPVPRARPTALRVVPREADDDEWVGAERSRPAAGERHGGSPGMALWVKLLKDAAARSRYGRPAEDSGASPAVARRLGGCVMRLLLAALFLFIALVAGLFLFGRSLLQGFAP